MLSLTNNDFEQDGTNGQIGEKDRSVHSGKDVKLQYNKG
jgi:hypothetical protein